MTAPIVKVVVTNKLPATGFAEVFLLVVAGFAVSLYILPTATGTANGILSFHTSNILCHRCFLFARRLPAYILGHHPKFIYLQCWIMRALRAGLMGTALQCRLNLAAAVAGNAANIADAAATGGHLPN